MADGQRWIDPCSASGWSCVLEQGTYISLGLEFLTCEMGMMVTSISKLLLGLTQVIYLIRPQNKRAVFFLTRHPLGWVLSPGPRTALPVLLSGAK